MSALSNTRSRPAREHNYLIYIWLLMLNASPTQARIMRVTEAERLCHQDAACYARTHRVLTERKCQSRLNETAGFPHVWWVSIPQPLFNSYHWYQQNLSQIIATGNKAYITSQTGLTIPLNYYCIYNGQTGDIVSAAFE